VLARPRPEPGVLHDRRPVHAQEIPQGDGDVDAGVGARPVGDHLGADEELAAVTSLLRREFCHRPPRQAARAGRDADMLRQGAARTWEASPGTLSSLCRESFY
jgi:hypothetical protein